MKYFPKIANLIFMSVLGVALVMPILFVSSAYSADNLSLIHKPPQGQDLPPPGVPMQLKVRVTGTRDTDLRLKALITRDGRAMQQYVNAPLLNEYDEPTYEMSFPAPLAEISYQFFLVKADQSILPSTRYLVRRTCVPKVDTGVLQIDPNAQGQVKMELMIAQSKALQQDVENLERAAKLATELQALLK